jgi:ArsR family transcriptional regulator
MRVLPVNPDRAFRAVSDPTRLRILSLLRDGELCVCDIVTTLEIPQPTASRHLAYLRKSGLVSQRKEGVWCYYRLAVPQNPFESSLQTCLACCRDAVPQFSKDQLRLQRLRNECCP